MLAAHDQRLTALDGIVNPVEAPVTQREIEPPQESE
jgi:hypothetical protein